MSTTRSNRAAALQSALRLSERKLQKLSYIVSQKYLHEGLGDAQLHLFQSALQEAAQHERLVLLEVLAGKSENEIKKSLMGLSSAFEIFSSRVSPEILQFSSESLLTKNPTAAKAQIQGKIDSKEKLEKSLVGLFTVTKGLMAIATSLEAGELNNLLQQIDPEIPLVQAFSKQKAAGSEAVEKMRQSPGDGYDPDTTPAPKPGMRPPPPKRRALRKPEAMGRPDLFQREPVEEAFMDVFKKRKYGIPGLSSKEYVDLEKQFDAEVKKALTVKAPGVGKYISIDKFLSEIKGNLSANKMRQVFRQFDSAVLPNVDNEFLQSAAMTASKTSVLKGLWDTLSGGRVVRGG